MSWRLELTTTYSNMSWHPLCTRHVWIRCARVGWVWLDMSQVFMPLADSKKHSILPGSRHRMTCLISSLYRPHAGHSFLIVLSQWDSLGLIQQNLDTYLLTKAWNILRKAFASFFNAIVPIDMVEKICWNLIGVIIELFGRLVAPPVVYGHLGRVSDFT